MNIPETTRLYLPWLEKRWGVDKRKIIEFARDNLIGIWADFFDVEYEFKQDDGSIIKEKAGSIELRFYQDSLKRLSDNSSLSSFSLPWTNGILKDNRQVLVQSNSFNRVIGTKVLRRNLNIEYAKVYAVLEDVIKFEKKANLTQINETSQPQSTEYQLPPKRENTYLKMIGAFLSMRYKADKYFKSSGQVNAAAIAEQFAHDLEEAGFNNEGLKTDSIRKHIIHPALEAIKENQKK